MNETRTEAMLEGTHPDARLTLARVTPRGVLALTGLRAAFTDLEKLGQHLGTERFCGSLSLHTSHLLAFALLLDGQFVLASALEPGGGGVWGNQALLQFVQGFGQGATLEARTLDAAFVLALSGFASVAPLPARSRSDSSRPDSAFTGTRIDGEGRCELVLGDRVIGTLHTPGAPFGAFMSPSTLPELHLPQAMGSWATARYALTLRGRDAVNPITDQYNRLRATLGKQALEVLGQLGRGKTPFELTDAGGKGLKELEGIVQALNREGLLRRREDPMI